MRRFHRFFLTIGGLQVEITSGELLEPPYEGDSMCRLSIYPDSYAVLNEHCSSALERDWRERTA